MEWNIEFVLVNQRMPHQRFYIQNDYKQKNNYDRPNQFLCSILINTFTIRVKNYEQKTSIINGLSSWKALFILYQRSSGHIS